MQQMSLDLHSFHLSQIFLFINIVTALKWTCSDTAGNLASNSTYGSNRDLISSSLASNAAKHNGYYNSSIGEGYGKVFALVNCRGDSSPEACSTCITTATDDLSAECPIQKEAISWGGDPPCIILLADHSFFGTLELAPSDQGANTGNITSDLTKFDIVWQNLTDSVTREASAGSSKLKFGTGEAELSPHEMIYVLMQCTPDISESDCSRCLRLNVGYFESFGHGRPGGYVFRPNCIFQWDFYRFYDKPSALPSTPTSNSSTPNATAEGKQGSSSQTIVVTVIPIVAFITIATITCTLLLRRWKLTKHETEVPEEIEVGEALQFKFNRIRLAKITFLKITSWEKEALGKLSDGQDVAVKRLSKNSNQGKKEFENEVKLMAKLQHRNLVRLLGFSIQREERLLVYEFLALSSLEKYIFDPTRSLFLDWDRRYKIIMGIARGILYLQEDSELRIIHRDIKASNILLDAEMNPKISDFGMAKLFPMDITQANASRVVGTLGYMAPEYVYHHQVSAKADVYSFGVLVLEIISGKRISHFSAGGEEFSSLLSYAWDNWKKGTARNLLDPNLKGAPETEVMRCIHLALLCVQENAAHRPSMVTAVLMLGSFSISVPAPSRPSFLLHHSSPSARHDAQLTGLDPSENTSIQFSANEASISELAPR